MQFFILIALLTSMLHEKLMYTAIHTMYRFNKAYRIHKQRWISCLAL